MDTSERQPRLRSTWKTRRCSASAFWTTSRDIERTGAMRRLMTTESISTSRKPSSQSRPYPPSATSPSMGWFASWLQIGHPMRSVQKTEELTHATWANWPPCWLSSFRGFWNPGRLTRSAGSQRSPLARGAGRTPQVIGARRANSSRTSVPGGGATAATRSIARTGGRKCGCRSETRWTRTSLGARQRFQIARTVGCLRSGCGSDRGHRRHLPDEAVD